jgi:hypothetical protein
VSLIEVRKSGFICLNLLILSSEIVINLVKVILGGEVSGQNCIGQLNKLLSVDFSKLAKVDIPVRLIYD